MNSFKQVPNPSQQGFTLVEIAVVLVIIGALLGGVLQGAKLIESSKVKKAIAEVNGVTAAYNAYQDKYGRQPGDDGNLNDIRARGGDWATVPRSGNSNGVVQVTAFEAFTGGGEHYAFWQQLRAAGLITGDHTTNSGSGVFPVNAYGGLIGLTSQSVMNGLSGLKVCLSQVPGSSALAMDRQTDDGQPDTGHMRATTSPGGANTPPGTAATAYAETDVYTMCSLL